MPKTKTKHTKSGCHTKGSSKPHFTLDKIRQAGICSHYENLKIQGLPARDCLKETAEFARISEKQAKGILSGNIQSTGKKKSFSEYLIEIGKSKNELVRTGSNKDERPLPKIQRGINRDSKLNDDEKQILTAEIKQSISDVDKPSRKMNNPTAKPQFNSIADAIKKI